jgi:hypothetical protein
MKKLFPVTEALHVPTHEECATSSHVQTLTSWASLDQALSNYAARAIYVLPIAGYIVLYSDYFQQLFKFTTLSRSWGFLTFSSRSNLLYHGSLVLLLAYVLFWYFCPILLRNTGDRYKFVTDIVTARERSTVLHISRQLRCYLSSAPESGDGTRAKAIFEYIKQRGEQLADGAGEYEDRIPAILSCYYNWQNFTRPYLRTVIFVLTGIGYTLVALPAVDLFLRVLQTDARKLFGW